MLSYLCAQAQTSQVIHSLYTDVSKLLISSNSVRLLNVVGQGTKLLFLRLYYIVEDIHTHTHLIEVFSLLPDLVVYWLRNMVLIRSKTSILVYEYRIYQGPRFLHFCSDLIDITMAS